MLDLQFIKNTGLSAVYNNNTYIYDNKITKLNEDIF